MMIRRRKPAGRCVSLMSKKALIEFGGLKELLTHIDVLARLVGFLFFGRQTAGLTRQTILFAGSISRKVNVSVIGSVGQHQVCRG